MTTSSVDPKLATAIIDARRFVSTRTTGVDVHYISAADTARLIRSALAKAFPGIPFRVRSRSYSGGSSVDVDWTDGPTKDAVDAALGGFRGHSFDGSIDLAFDSDCYITRAGTIGFAATYGTAGSGGMVPAAAVPVPDGATIVTFLPYIMADRHYSADRDVTDPDVAAWRRLAGMTLPAAPAPR